ncbi:MAG TPA: pyruvate dehydrogenase (acetyl-transferring) E1 component subunit alpha [Gemmatimonadaceae bacterium]|nr:pyruvate dehydrogenase (acetyl-transferring) E1 component subunit alpha [Gemmatimonadaceae bacterium]
MSTEAKRAPAQKQKDTKPQPKDTKPASRNNGSDGSTPLDRGMANTTPQLRHELLHSMMVQRRFEERCAEAYALGKIGGFCHLYIGQEAISTGVMSMIRPDDYVITAYRDHGQALARGMSPRAIMAELFGRETGCSGGKGGSMHLFDAETNFLGGHGIVGGHVPIAAGVGFAIKYRRGNQVCVCFFGEAAVNIGAFHEALNMASLWDLPVIFIIENNRYGMGTAISRSTANEDVVVRAKGYRMDGESVDGQDVFAVRDVMARALERARKEKRPTLIEMKTYRFMGHSMSDAVSGTYRTKDELEENMKRDPILLLHNKMFEAGELTEGEMHKLDDEAKAIAQDAWDFADSSPEPPLEKLYTDVYSDTTS